MEEGRGPYCHIENMSWRPDKQFGACLVDIKRYDVLFSFANALIFASAVHVHTLFEWRKNVFTVDRVHFMV